MKKVLFLIVLLGFTFAFTPSSPPDYGPEDGPLFEIQSESEQSYRVTWTTAHLLKAVIDVARKVPPKKSFTVRVLGEPLNVKYEKEEYLISHQGQITTYKNIESVRAFIISYYTSSKVVIG